MTFNFSKPFKEGYGLSTLIITTKIMCTFSLGQAFIVMKFLDPHLITDSSGNVLSSTILQDRAQPNTYISGSEQAAVASSGGSFSASSFITFVLLLGLSLLQGTAIGSFWAFINMLQILSYLPIINCNLPYNLEVFLTQYLQVAQVTFPFQMIPNYIPNPLAFFAPFLTPPFNVRFSLCGYVTLSFLYNFASDLLTWLCLLGVYCILYIVTRLFPKPRYLFIFSDIDASFFINGRKNMNSILF